MRSFLSRGLRRDRSTGGRGPRRHHPSHGTHGRHRGRCDSRGRACLAARLEDRTQRPSAPRRHLRLSGRDSAGVRSTRRRLNSARNAETPSQDQPCHAQPFGRGAEAWDVAFWKRDKNCRFPPTARLRGATSAARITPTNRSCRSAGKRPERCQPRRPWKSLLPPGHKNGRTCLRSGAELAPAPSIAGSSGPRRTAILWPQR